MIEFINKILEYLPAKYSLLFLSFILFGFFLWKIFSFVRNFKDIEKEHKTCHANFSENFKKMKDDFLDDIKIEITKLSILNPLRYGQGNSPFKLKSDFEKFVRDSGLAEQIKNNKEEIINIVKQNDFKTELDLQKVLVYVYFQLRKLDILDFSKIDKKAYEKGMVAGDLDNIIIIYLWQVFIPELTNK